MLVLVLVLTGGAALLADFWLDLPALTRQAAFSAWVALGGAVLLLGILLPLCRRLDPTALASKSGRGKPACRHDAPSCPGLTS